MTAPRHDSHSYWAGTVRVEPWRWRNQRLFRYVGPDRLNGGKLRGDEVQVAMKLKERRTRQTAAKEAENAEPIQRSLF